MNNINIYNERMAKAIEDKLWFLRFLSMPTFNKNAVVYDFGCADGELIRHIASLFPNVKFVGIDNSLDMINLARQRQTYPNETYRHNTESFVDRNVYDNPIMIMSSVYHEIVNYMNTIEFRDILKWIEPNYIFFRDMIPDKSINRKSLQEDMDKIRNKEWDDQKIYPKFSTYVNGFEVLQGPLTKQRNLVHFLLKYRYRENWSREVTENYFPCTYNELIDRFGSLNYQPVYSKQYILPYIQETVKKDFDIDLRDNTHVNIIFKRTKNK